jgi:hypothetical protein
MFAVIVAVFATRFIRDERAALPLSLCKEKQLQS